MYKKLNNVKQFIEDATLGNLNFANFYTEEGSGREVVMFEDYAIKMPLGDYNEVTNGCNQNLKELEVWLSTKHPYLAPIYGIHMGCLISKRVEADMEYICEKYNFTIEDIENNIKQRLPEVINIAKEFDLDIGDISKMRSWGYDEDLGFVCVDYGFVDYSQESFEKLISNKKDEDLLKAYDYANHIIASRFFNVADSKKNNVNCNNSLQEIFGNNLYFNLRLCKIIMNELVERNLAFYAKDISLIKNKILKELSNENEFNSKLVNYYGKKLLYIKALNIDVIINNNYEDSMKEIFDKVEKYYEIQAFLITK